MIDTARLHAAYDRVRRDLLAERVTAGHWIGQLSSSALSTATAVSALALVQRNSTPHDRFDRLIAGAVRWLAGHQNADGGWGDTDRSHSNIATTMLVRAALQLAGQADEHSDAMAAAQRYIDAQGGLGGLRARYGRDRTFAVPILTNAALAEPGRLVRGAGRCPSSWRACRSGSTVSSVCRWSAMPSRRWWRSGKPATFTVPSVWPWMRWLRRAAIEPSLRVLRTMQPDSGGYLEAAPLTSFVVMSLAATGRADHSGDATRREVLAGFRPSGRQLADRYESGNVDHDAGDQRLGRRRRRRGGAGLSGLAAVVPASTDSSVHRRRAGRVGLERSERRRAGRGRHARGAVGAGRVAGRAFVLGRRPRPHRSGRGGAASAGCWTCRIVTAAGRRFAAAGASCRSTAAAPI